MKRKLLLSLLLAGTFLTSGCITAIKSGYIITQKERFFGIKVAQGPNQVPEVELGFGSVVTQMIPTSTNGPINAPKYADTFNLDQGLNPFGFEVIENTATGDVNVGTNGAITARLNAKFTNSIPVK